MLLAYKRLNYQKHISRLRRPQQNFAETGRIELNSDFFYALEDVLDEQGNHDILHHHFETFSLEERKMLYELFREDKTSLLYEKATTDKKHKILRILCFFVTISCVFVVEQNL